MVRQPRDNFDATCHSRKELSRGLINGKNILSISLQFLYYTPCTLTQTQFCCTVISVRHASIET